MDNDMKKEVYNIFVDFFGEDKVDLSNNNIIIHFPKVTVTNEYDKSINITDLWVRVPILNNGTINGIFCMCRSTTSIKEFTKGYRHSHLPISYGDSYFSWGNPCLGRGPINLTISSLSIEYSKDLWQLFCVELLKYVETESIAGIPYIKLEYVGNNRYNKYPSDIKYVDSTNCNINRDIKPLFDKFMLYILLKKPFRFNYINNSYGIAMSNDELTVVLSNLFIEFYNSLDIVDKLPANELFSKGLLSNGKMAEGNKLYVMGFPESEQYNQAYAELELFTFKGNTVTSKVVENSIEKDENECILLTPYYRDIIVNKILKIINNDYRKSTATTKEISGYL